MSDCEKSLGLLSDFRDGGLDELEVTWIKAHLDGCGDCHGIFKELDMIVATAGSLRVEDAIAFPDEDAVWVRIGMKRTGH